MEPSYMVMSPLPNPWARISEIAARVGVKPRDEDPVTISAKGADDKNYDVWEVIAKVLDRMDECTKQRDSEQARLLAEAYGVINILLNFTPDGLGSFHLETLVIARDRAEQFMAKVGKRDPQAGHPKKQK